MLSKFLNPHVTVRVSVGFLKKSSPRPQSQKWAPLFCAQNHSHFMRTFHSGALLLNDNNPGEKNNGKELLFDPIIVKIMKAMGIEESSEDWDLVGNFLKSKAKVKEANWGRLADQKVFDKLTKGAKLGLWEASLQQTIQKMLNPPAAEIFKEKISKLQELRKTLREDKDSKYDILLDQPTKVLTAPTIISLPYLSELLVDESDNSLESNSLQPKGFSKEHFEQFLLTEQRKELLDKVKAFVKSRQGNGGIAPVGPHGIGKSGLGVLLACYAFVNSHFLIYIPECAQWTKGTETQVAKKFIKTFLKLNADLAGQVKGIYSKKTLLEVAVSTEFIDDPSQVLFNFEEILESLRTVNNRAVFHILDEHNELFSVIDKEGNTAVELYGNVLKSFTKWQGPTNGRRTYTVYIGSAHTKFLDAIAGGEEFRKEYLLPPTEKEAVILLKQMGASPELYQDKSALANTKRLTGFLPREMQDLIRTKDASQYVRETIGKFSRRTSRFYNTLRKPNEPKSLEQKQYERFLFFLFMKRYWNPKESDPSPSIGPKDSGLFYEDKTGFHFVSSLAREASRDIFLSGLEENLSITERPINSELDASVKGTLHERWNIFRFCTSQVIRLKPFVFGYPEMAQPAAFQFSVHYVVPFDTDETMEPNSMNQQRLYVPTDRSHPNWDVIYDDGTLTAFFQFSISDFWDGHYVGVQDSVTTLAELEKRKAEKEATKQSKVPKSDDEKTPAVVTNAKQVYTAEEKAKITQVSIIMDSLRGTSGHKIYWDEATQTLIKKDPQGNDLTNLHFFYGCGAKTREAMIEEGGTQRKAFAYSFMKFFAREDMEANGVVF